MAGTIAIERRERVLVATLANPPHALMDETIVAALGDLVARADSDPEVGGVVLTGAHESRFLAHYDVDELLAGAKAAPRLSPAIARASLRAAGTVRRVPGGHAALERTPAAGLAAVERFKQTLLGIQRCAAVWVAALNGSAMGGGCELALACDVRMIAAGDHLVGQPEILFGFPPGGGGTQRLARMLGSSRALRIVLEGTPFDPERAAEVGLVDRVVPPAELLEAAVADAAHLGAREKLAIGACKRAIYEGGSLPLADGLRLENAEFMSAVTAPGAIAAMQSYVNASERLGDLAGYDRETLAAADEHGRFV
jgi:enoyl-CoA hydratase/carnithine racemase